MRTTRFDDCCPHCGEKVADLDNRAKENFMNDFDLTCQHCNKPFAVQITMVPEYALCSETNEEADRRAWERVLRFKPWLRSVGS